MGDVYYYVPLSQWQCIHHGEGKNSLHLLQLSPLGMLDGNHSNSENRWHLFIIVIYAYDLIIDSTNQLYLLFIFSVYVIKPVHLRVVPHFHSHRWQTTHSDRLNWTSNPQDKSTIQVKPLERWKIFTEVSKMWMDISLHRYSWRQLRGKYIFYCQRQRFKVTYCLFWVLDNKL